MEDGKKVAYNKNADKALGALSALYVTTLLANVTIGYRYISIFNIDLAGGIFIFPLSFIIGDIISEVYDSNYAKSLILYGFACQLIFSLYIHFIIRMPHPIFWEGEKIYFDVMDNYLRFTMASSISIIFGSWLNIHFLSKWSDLLHGRSFAPRSIGAAFIGELFVTVFSMVVANYGKMATGQLIYMMACCFSVKTLISLLAAWPAAFVVCALKEGGRSDDYDQIKGRVKSLFDKLYNFSKPAFRLDRINIESKRAYIYCRGARVAIEKDIAEVILNPKIIQKMDPIQSGQIGYYYGLLYEMKGNKSDFLQPLNKKSNFFLNFLKDKYIILSMLRDGSINYSANDFNGEMYTDQPVDIYRDHSLIMKFESSHACYIGLLVGIAERKSVNAGFHHSKPMLVVNNSRTHELTA